MDINALLAFLPAKYIGIVGAVIGLFAAVTAIVPPPKNRRTLWGFIYTGMDWLALNVGHGKTAAKAVANGEVIKMPSPIPPAAPPSAAKRSFELGTSHLDRNKL